MLLEGNVTVHKLSGPLISSSLSVGTIFASRNAMKESMLLPVGVTLSLN